MTFLSKVPTNSVLVGTGDFDSDLNLSLPSCRPCRHFSSCLSCPLLAALFPKLSTSVWSACSVLRSNRLESELTSAGFNAGLNLSSNLLVRDQTCTVCGKDAVSLGTRASSAAVLMFSSRVDVVVPLALLLVSAHHLLPLFDSRWKILEFSPTWNQNLSLLPAQKIPAADQTSQRLETRWSCSEDDAEAFAFCHS